MNQDNGGVIGKINTPTTTVASGVWSIQDQFEAQSSSTWPLAFPQTTIANSCRFDGASSDRLTIANPTAGNRKTGSISFWIKFCDLNANHNIYNTYNSSASGYSSAYIQVTTAGRIEIVNYQASGGSHSHLGTNRLLRDFSAWYHCLCVWDTTQSTSSDRLKIFINGTQETSFSTATYPSLNEDLFFDIGGTSNPRYIGYAFTAYMDAYLAEMNYVNGQALTPTSFGAFNPVTNIWEPIPYTGTYGDEGFRLDFADSSALGNDVSGNDNDFTPNNLTSVDQSTDTCSNNFATMNPLYKLSNVTFSEGNLQHTNAGNWQPGLSTIGVSSGKWYFESKFTAVTGGSNNAFIGISLDTEANGLTLVGNSANSYGYENTGQKKNNTSSASYGDSWTVGDIVSCYVDLDNGAIYFGKNGTVQASGDPTSGSTKTNAAYTFTTGGTYLLGVSDYYGTQQVNYGSPPFSISSGNADANGHGNFEYAVPSGYFALNTKNLAEFG